MEKASTLKHIVNGVPEIQPLKSLGELLSWQPDRYESLFCKSSQRLLPRRKTSATQPRFLCCHDMRGGYLEDRLVQGGGDGRGYTFRHWSLIDIFVYFSHHLVTVPPPGWTSAAHLHGVPVLGTFITEWEAGSATCLNLLASDAMVERCAHQLAMIAKHLGFDGWIVNIENEIPKKLIPRLLYFLKCLTKATNSAVEGGCVIWYDAVTLEGSLDWQNMLTELNKPFFDACDGIWLNYCWKESDIVKLQSLAGSRAHEVYLGVDAFGRGCLGGGGMNVDVALAAVKRAGTSVALFACAWAFETVETSMKDQDNDRFGRWEERDERFWCLIHKAWGCNMPVAQDFPIDTSFCTGSGSRYLQNGIAFGTNQSWYNLSLQSLQPKVEFVNHPVAGSQLKITTRHDISYTGGSCLVFDGAIKSAIHIYLFKTDINVPPFGFKMFMIAHVEGAVTLRACLELQQRTEIGFPLEGENKTVELGPGGFNASLRDAIYKPATRSVQSLARFNLPEGIFNSGITTNRPERHWTIWEFDVGESDLMKWFGRKDVSIKSVGLIVAPKLAGAACRCNIMLGAVRLEEKSEKKIPSVRNLNLEGLGIKRQTDAEGKEVSVLRGICLWKLPIGNGIQGSLQSQIWVSFENSRDDSANNVSRWTAPRWFGVTCAEAYLLHDIVLPRGATAVKIFVATATSTKVQSLQDAASATFDL